MIESFIRQTAWKMTPPAAYGTFHLSFSLIGFAVCIFLAFLLRNLSEKRHRTLMMTVGLVLMVSELYKQLFYYYYIGGGHYQWWIFPFQLCSIPMYLCVLAGLIRPGKLSRSIGYFLSTFNLIGGFISFFEPSGLCHEYWTLTLHAFIWHMLLVFVGVYLIASGRGCRTAKDFLGAVCVFLSLCVIAFAINLIFRNVSGGSINMFFVGPSDNSLAVFKDIAKSFGWYVATALYVPCVCVAAAAPWAVARLLHRREKSPV